MLSLQTVCSREKKFTQALCANAHGFSLHAAVRLAVSISASTWNVCAVTLPDRRSLMSGSNATALARWCCN